MTHVYVGQQHNGIKVFNAISSIAVKDGKVFYFGNSFIKNVQDKINSVSPIITQTQAIKIVADYFKLDNTQDARLLSSQNNKSYEPHQSQHRANCHFHPQIQGDTPTCHFSVFVGLNHLVLNELCLKYSLGVYV